MSCPQTLVWTGQLKTQLDTSVNKSASQRLSLTQKLLKVLRRCHSSQAWAGTAIHCFTAQVLQWLEHKQYNGTLILQTVFYFDTANCILQFEGALCTVHNCAHLFSCSAALFALGREVSCNRSCEAGDSHGRSRSTTYKHAFALGRPFELTTTQMQLSFLFHFISNLATSLQIAIPKFNLNQTTDAFKPQFSRQSPEAISGRNKLKPTFQSKHFVFPSH